MHRPPDRATFTALRATRDATRLAGAILLDRVTGLGRVHCSRCGRAIAAATDAARPAGDSGGHVVCHICVRAEQVAAALVAQLPEPPLEHCIGQLEEWIRAGLIELPVDPGPPPDSVRTAAALRESRM